jgi:hypothetical protein
MCAIEYIENIEYIEITWGAVVFYALSSGAAEENRRLV